MNDDLKTSEHAEEVKKKQEEDRLDLENRIKSFNAEFMPLLGKYKLSLTAEPFYAQTPEGVYITLAKPTLINDVRPPTPPPQEPVGELAKVD